MCNCDDDLNCVPKYKAKLCLFDKIVISFVFAICSISLALMLIGLFNPQYIMCN